MKKIFIVLGIVFSSTVTASWFDSDEVQFVKEAQMNACPSVTLEQLVDGYMASPKWQSLEADERSFVNIKGGIYLHEKPIDALLQFEINDDETLHINALEFNDIPQNQFMAVGLIESMCEAVMVQSM